MKGKPGLLFSGVFRKLCSTRYIITCILCQALFAGESRNSGAVRYHYLRMHVLIDSRLTGF